MAEVIPGSGAESKGIAPGMAIAAPDFDWGRAVVQCFGAQEGDRGAFDMELIKVAGPIVEHRVLRAIGR